MAMDQQAPMPSPEEGQAQSGGGASKLAADAHSSLLKFADLVSSQYPEEGKALSGLVSQLQQIVEGLGQSPDAQAPQPGAQTMPSDMPPGAKQVM